MKTAMLTMILILAAISHSVTAETCLHSKVSGQGQAILLMPGFVSDDRVWDDVAAQLATEFQVHQLSVAGFGKYPACAQRDRIFQQVEGEINTYLATKKLNNPIFIGHSMGGLMAFKLAMSNNDLSKVISVDGLPFIGPIFTRTNLVQVDDLVPQAQRLKAMYESANAETLAFMTKQGLSVQTSDPGNYAKIVDMASQSDPVTAASAIYSVMTTDLRSDISKLQVPAMLLGASGGGQTDNEHQQIEHLFRVQLAGSPMAQLTMNTQGRHFLMWDQPQWLLNQIREFIGEAQ